MNNLLIPSFTYFLPKKSFLEDLNSIVNLGKIPHLFENEELDSIIVRIRSLALQSGYTDDRKSLLSFFQKVWIFLWVGFIKLSC